MFKIFFIKKKKKRNVKGGRETTETDFFLNSFQTGVAQKLLPAAAHSYSEALVRTVGGLGHIFGMGFSMVCLPVTSRRVKESLSVRAVSCPPWHPPSTCAVGCTWGSAPNPGEMELLPGGRRAVGRRGPWAIEMGDTALHHLDTA